MDNKIVKGPTKKMNRRMLGVLAAFVLVGFIPLCVRLFIIQVVDYDYYQQKAISQQMRDTTITPKRGNIYDRNMKTLALSASVDTVVLSPAGLRGGKDINGQNRAEFVADKLSALLGVDRQTIYDKTQKKSYYETVKRKIEKDEANLVLEFLEEYGIESVWLVEDSKRYYPYGNFASNLLGFVGVDEQGLEGLEAYYDEYLSGQPGRVISAKNAAGVDMNFQYEKYIDAENGSNLVLTLDEVVQHFLEKHLETALIENKLGNKAVGIVMDVNTGGILAMSTKPDYDLNDPFTIVDEATLQELSLLSGDEYSEARTAALQQMWRNKAVSDPFMPGSTFKILTTAMALEESVVSESDTFNCTGGIMVPGWSKPISCWKHGGHGHQTFLEGIQNSCNPVFITLGQRLGIESFRKYYEAFGLMEKTGVDLPGEANGYFWSESNFNIVELSTAAFGQNFKITPLQLITAVSAASNGGYLVTPHVAKELVDDGGRVVYTFDFPVKRQVISEETSAQLSQMLESVVSLGTGKNAYVKGYHVAGKTGTSEKVDEKDPETGEIPLIASFVGFAPADNPQVAVLVMLDEPNGESTFGGVIAAPVVGNIMADILPYLGIAPQYSDKELADLEISIPVLEGLGVSEAKAELEALGLKARVVGDGEEVLEQVPRAAETMPKDGSVILYTTGDRLEQATVPDLHGLTAEQANVELVNAGLNIKIMGVDVNKSGVMAYGQDHEAGALVTPGTVVTVEFRHNTGH